jgi:hypothetical protein
VGEHMVNVYAARRVASADGGGCDLWREY